MSLDTFTPNEQKIMMCILKRAIQDGAGIKIDYDGVAQDAGYANGASVSTAWSKLRKKILGCTPTNQDPNNTTPKTATTPKERAAKTAADGDTPVAKRARKAVNAKKASAGGKNKAGKGGAEVGNGGVDQAGEGDVADVEDEEENAVKAEMYEDDTVGEMLKEAGLDKDGEGA